MNFQKFFFFSSALMVLFFCFALIEPMKTLLDSPRSSMNCPGTTNFNQANWDAQTPGEELIYAPTCWVMNLGMLAFIGTLVTMVFWWMIT